MREDFQLNSIGEDVRALRIVSPAYAGRDGELTAILQYVFQSVLLGASGNRELASLISGIAAEEMRHLQILGTLLVRLGASPVFTACPPYPVSYYSASCVNYAKTPQEMLSADVAAERAAMGEYDRMLSCLENAPVSAVISRIRQEEAEHLRLFREAQEKLASV